MSEPAQYHETALVHAVVIDTVEEEHYYKTTKVFILSEMWYG